MPRFFTSAAAGAILLFGALAARTADAQINGHKTSSSGLPRVPTPKYPGQSEWVCVWVCAVRTGPYLHGINGTTADWRRQQFVKGFGSASPEPPDSSTD
jgi:hypothetical protein